MRLRRFVGTNPAAALLRVKQTLGPDAVILGTRAVDGGVEITAAVDLDPPDAARAPAAERDPAALQAITRELGTLSARIARLDRALAPPVAAALGPEARTLAERLHAYGASPLTADAVGRSFAAARGAGLAEGEALAASLERHVRTVGPAAAPRVTALVGPTGAGKTTTIAKLSARAAAGGAAVGLVMADTYRIGAAEQLGIYARLLDVPMQVARDADDLAAALAALADRDVVYVDTPGLGGDADGAAALARLLAAPDGGIATVAVVPAGASEGALRRAWQQLGALAPAACVVTKVDEAGGLWAAWEWLAGLDLPLAWLGTGTRVPDDLAPGDGRTMAAWLTAA